MIVLGATMKATLILCFVSLSCVSLLVGAKSIHSNHGKPVSLSEANFQKLFMFVTVEKLRLTLTLKDDFSCFKDFIIYINLKDKEVCLGIKLNKQATSNLKTLVNH